jgi:fucose permease
MLLIGMTTGRVVGGQLSRRIAPSPLIFGALPVAAIGFVGFWLVDTPVISLGGLFVAGLGLALLFPLTLALALEASRGRTEVASARAVFATGVAVALAPFALGALADRAGLGASYAIVPVLLATGVAMLVAARRGANR